MKTEYEVVIVGAGPAGCSAAIHLKKKGIDVLLIDKLFFPRDKICGDGIPGKCFPLLVELGINRDTLFRLGYPIRQMQIHTPTGESIQYGDLQDKHNTKSICMPRKTFDFLLLSRAKEILNGIALGEKLIEIENNTNAKHTLLLRNIKTDEEHRIQTKIIIGADGVHSTVSRHTSMVEPTNDNRLWGIRSYCECKDIDPVVYIFYHKNILPGYAWIFPVSENKANVGMIVTMETMRNNNKNISDLFKGILSEHPVFNKNIGFKDAFGPIKSFPLKVGTTKASRVRDGIILTGDAAYFTNPLTGGGIYNAILSGKLAAKVSYECIRKNDLSYSQLSRYDVLWKKNIYSSFYYANLVQKVLRNEMIASWWLRSCSKRKINANLFLALYGNPLPRFALINPLFWLKVVMG